MTYELQTFDFDGYDPTEYGRSFDSEKHGSILEFLEDSRIIKFYKTVSGDFVVEEKCDDYFFANLTHDQMVLLLFELTNLVHGKSE